MQGKDKPLATYGPFAGKMGAGTAVVQRDEAPVRQLALEMAVRTLAGSQKLTVGMVVQTADAYAKYILNGDVPPLPQTATPERGTDAEV